MYDALFYIGDGIGNCLEAFYAIEYCLHQNGLKVGVRISSVPESFIKYLKHCYGPVILSESTRVQTKNLIHSWIANQEIIDEYENYICVSANDFSTHQQSETELYLSIVRAIYPSSYTSKILTYLKTTPVEGLNIKNKIVLYPGSSSDMPAKRWPHFLKLTQALAEENVLIIGGHEDVCFDVSYAYPEWLGRLVPTVLLKRQAFWKMSKPLLIPYAHNGFLPENKNVHIDRFTWSELAFICRHSKFFVGNDGGLSHLAGAVGGKGVVLFGPTSIAKNKPFNDALEPLALNLSCQPCQFGNGEVIMAKGWINCPRGVKCLNNLSFESVLQKLRARTELKHPQESLSCAIELSKNISNTAQR